MDDKIKELSMMQKIVTSDSATFYWDKPRNMEGKSVYQILCNGKEAGTTDKTHYTLTGLAAETEYTVEIRLLIGEEPGSGDCAASEETIVKTGKEKDGSISQKSPI